KLTRGSGNFQPRAPLAYRCAGAAMAGRSVGLRPESSRPARHQQPPRFDHVFGSCGFAFLLCPQEARLKDVRKSKRASAVMEKDKVHPCGSNLRFRTL